MISSDRSPQFGDAPWRTPRIGGCIAALPIVLGAIGCGDDVAAPASAIVSGQVIHADGTPVEGAHINFVYEFVAVSATGNAAQQSATGGLTIYPNPFEQNTTLRFEVEGSASGMLDMLDANHDPVRSLLLSSKFPGGMHSVIWDGRDEGQSLLPNGLYHAHLALQSNGAEVVEEVPTLRNDSDGSTFAATWEARTAADGAFSIPRSTLPVGATIIPVDLQGVAGDPLVVADMVTLWATLPGNPPLQASTRISVAQNVFVQLQLP